MKPSNFKSRLLIASTFLLAVCVSIFGGYLLLKRFSSKEYVLTKSIENIGIERQNATKTKKIILDNSASIENIKLHNIYTVEQVPTIIETLESYADILNLPITINNISFSSPDKNKPKNEEENTVEGNTETKKIQKELTLDITSHGDFDKIMRLIKLFENADYIFKIKQYSIKQIIVNKEAASSYSDTGFMEVSSSDLKPDMPKSWVLRAQLTMQTNIN